MRKGNSTINVLLSYNRLLYPVFRIKNILLYISVLALRHFLVRVKLILLFFWDAYNRKEIIRNITKSKIASNIDKNAMHFPEAFYWLK